MSETRIVLTYFGKILPFALATAAVWFLCLLGRMKHARRPIRAQEEALRLLLWLSVAAILSQTLTPSGRLSDFRLELSRTREFYNFIPFRFFRILAGYGWKFNSYFLINILGNIAVFVPAGFAYLLVHRSGLGRAVLFGGGLSLFIELAQIFLPRTTDIDDLILNTLGALLGALAAAGVLRLSSGRVKNHS